MGVALLVVWVPSGVLASGLDLWVAAISGAFSLFTTLLFYNGDGDGDGEAELPEKFGRSSGEVLANALLPSRFWRIRSAAAALSALTLCSCGVVIEIIVNFIPAVHAFPQ